MFGFMVAFVALSGLNAATYYVSPDGDNSNPGTIDEPWATPGYGSKHISSGDTLIILSGTYIISTYWDDMITPPSGTPSAWTVIMGQGDPRPVIKGSNNILDAIEITDSSYIKIANLELTSLIDTPYSGGMREGIEAGGSGDSIATVSHIVIEDMVIHDVEENGINFAGDIDDVRVSGCSIHHTGMTGISAPSGSGNGWTNVLIEDTYIGYSGYFYQGQRQPSPYDRPDGIGMEESEGPLEIRNVVSEHNRGDGIDSKSRRTYVHECVIANNWADGLKLWGDSSRAVNVLVYGTGDGDSTPSPWCLIVIETDDVNGYFELVNITAYDDSSRGHYTMTVQYGISTPIDVVMRNCIISGSRRAYFEPSVNLTAEHNLFYVMDEDVQIYANGTEYTSSNLDQLGVGNIYGDPKFVRPAWGETGDFHLMSTSPAIDSGTSAGSPNIDLDGNGRPNGSSCDIGAYEYYAPPVKINEIFYDAPTGIAEPYAEWIELYNPESNPIDISGWFLTDEEDTFSFTNGTVIPANGYLIACYDSDTFQAHWSVPAGVPIVEHGLLRLGNSGDDLALLDTGRFEVDVVWYGNGDRGPEDAAPDVPAGHSIARDPDGFDTDVPSNDFVDCGQPSPGSSNPPSEIGETTNPMKSDGFLIYPTVLNRQKVLKVVFDRPLERDEVLKLYDINGRVVRTIRLPSGIAQFSIGLQGLPCGVYFAKIKGENRGRASKLILIR
ncbi:MAG: hypothetical protein DRQ10_08425 [Candidatus Hydrothermota bacterium]|nr:MAG: hypothetical protein DRQ10_08425 [Candidatus Hydrothermae bacterium]